MDAHSSLGEATMLWLLLTGMLYQLTTDLP